MVRFNSSPDDHQSGNTGTRKPRPAPNYFSRSVQYRMLIMVFTLLAVLFMAGQAAKPSTWAWMFPGVAPETGTETQHEDPEIDTRLRDQSPRSAGSLPPGVVEISSSSESMIDRYEDSEELFLGIAPENYNVVRDNTVFRGSELKLWYELLGGMRDADVADLRTANAPSVGFTQLYKQPNSYRGRLVTVRGTVRRAHRITASKNDSRIQSYVRCWLFPEGSPNPVVVYATTMPDEFPEGMELNEAAEFRGVFFKRWAYKAEGGLMTAPMVLAKTANWRPAPVVVPKKVAPDGNMMPAMFVLAAIVAAAIALTVYRQSVQSESLPTVETEASALRESFDELGKMEFESPAEAMERKS